MTLNNQKGREGCNVAFAGPPAYCLYVYIKRMNPGPYLRACTNTEFYKLELAFISGFPPLAKSVYEQHISVVHPLGITIFIHCLYMVDEQI